MTNDTPSEARERVLDMAERLFSERGYAGLKLKDLAQALNIKQASLYYHVPGGKEHLYIEVMERNAERHRLGLEAAIHGAGDDLREQLRAAARWLLSQPPVDMQRMIHADLKAIDPQAARQLTELTYRAVLQPLMNIFWQRRERGEIVAPEITLLAGSFLSTIQAIHMVQDDWLVQSREAMADDMIDVILHGLLPRP